MPITRKEKEQQVSEIVNLISKSKIIIIWDYLGLNSNELVEVRKKLREEEAFNKIYKNRVAKVAFEKSKKKEILNDLVGPTSFMFIEKEDSKALSALNKFIKNNENISFKAGYINDVYYDQKAIVEIADLPSKDELLSMLASALQGTIRNLAYAISQIEPK